ncbi:molybdenum ABC transporter substrate-binding protein [Xylanibacillus composti]|uniref:Molybdenum ABC transporter substrate-binding protein n=1 Tax=Xylanibacillus composti TaxID=1572762 RepID=A0A8J4M2G6_9BACL|nr:molybdate ABC transporter substrate-binding protein [Xylanibacillus composti]GIQ69649.1 molybdenum ABC transporter substrate-binding protein [Xylanibacillus composti]
MRASRFAIISLALSMAVTALSACGAAASTKEASASVTVYAAASLKSLLEAAQVEFSKEYPDIGLQFNFAGTHVLKTQIEQGAEADVFLAAREQDVQALQEQGLAGPISRFTGNQLVIVVNEESSRGIQTVDDLANEGVLLVMAEPKAPVGEYAQRLIDQLEQSGQYGSDFKERFMRNVVSYESNEQHVLAKVELGEADAGIVYTSSLAAASIAGKRLSHLQIPESLNVTAHYYAARMNPASAAAQTFLDWLESEKGKALQARYGYDQGG